MSLAESELAVRWLKANPAALPPVPACPKCTAKGKTFEGWRVTTISERSATSEIDASGAVSRGKPSDMHVTSVEAQCMAAGHTVNAAKSPSLMAMLERLIGPQPRKRR